MSFLKQIRNDTSATVVFNNNYAAKNSSETAERNFNGIHLHIEREASKAEHNSANIKQCNADANVL